MENARRSPDVHLNLNVRGLAPSATMAINARSEALQREGRAVHKLGLGQSPFPVPESLVAELRRNAHQKSYLPVKGLFPLREAVAAFHRREQGLERSAEDVLIGPGSKELLFVVQLTHYGDLVIPTPSWVSYAPQAQIVGHRVSWVPTRLENGWQPTAEDLERVCARDPHRPRLIVLNYPNNPSGTSIPIEQLRSLAEVARAHGAILLSDEIYGGLDFDGSHVSIARFYPEGTIVSTGISKWCGAGGWRLGAFLFPPELRWLLDAMAVVASETYTSTSAPIQHAAIAAFAPNDELPEYLGRARAILRALAFEAADRLERCGARVARPDGAFYLFPDFTPIAAELRHRGIATSVDLCERLLQETGVAILPGSEFGRPPEELTARLALVDFDGDAAMRAARRVDRGSADRAFVEEHCGNVLRAIDLIARFASGLS